MQPYLKSFIDQFKGISSSGKLQFALAKWYFDSKRFAHGYICLAEAIITRILEIYRERDNRISWNKRSRDKVKNLIRDNTFQHNSDYKKLCEEYENISKRRNLIAHAGFDDRKIFKEDISKAYKHLRNVEQYVFNNKALEKLPEEFPFSKLYV